MTQRPPVVLLVEDHADSREMYSTVLTAAGFEVLQAADGVEALAVASSAMPDIVVTDLWLLGSAVSAEDVCRHFHGFGVPVLAVTGVAPGRDHDAMRHAGCSAVLMKPVAPDRLVVEVRRHLDPREHDDDSP